jgi:hypothetical protein
MGAVHEDMHTINSISLNYYWNEKCFQTKMLGKVKTHFCIQ